MRVLEVRPGADGVMARADNANPEPAEGQTYLLVRLAIAHECHFEGRRFIHLTFRNDRNLLSLIITPKQEGESPRAAGIVPALSRSGIALYGGRVEQFQTAAFETREFVVYTVSDLPRAKNLGILAAFAHDVSERADRRRLAAPPAGLPANPRATLRRHAAGEVSLTHPCCTLRRQARS